MPGILDMRLGHALAGAERCLRGAAGGTRAGVGLVRPTEEEILPQQVLATTVVGSYPQPDWLVDRSMLSKGVRRVRLQGMWRIPEPWLEQAQDDATVVAIRDMERAGIDIITDGEIRRESYSNRFATALEGVDVARPGIIRDRAGKETAVPRIVGRIRRGQA